MPPIVRRAQHDKRERSVPSVSVDGRTPGSMLTIRRANGARRMERMAFRAQTIVADVALASAAFALAYLVAASGAPALDITSFPTLSLAQLTVLYAALAGGFSMLFRRELSPWRYASIPDALVLARIAILTVGVFLLWVFIIDRARGLPRSTLFLAPMFQMVGSMGVRILRRALHEHALDSFAPLKTMADRITQ